MALDVGVNKESTVLQGWEWRGPGDLEHTTGRRVEQREGGGNERPQEKGRRRMESQTFIVA